MSSLRLGYTIQCINGNRCSGIYTCVKTRNIVPANTFTQKIQYTTNTAIRRRKLYIYNRRRGPAAAAAAVVDGVGAAAERGVINLSKLSRAQPPPPRAITVPSPPPSRCKQGSWRGGLSARAARHPSMSPPPPPPPTPSLCVPVPSRHPHRPSVRSPDRSALPSRAGFPPPPPGDQWANGVRADRDFDHRPRCMHIHEATPPGVVAAPPAGRRSFGVVFRYPVACVRAQWFANWRASGACAV